MSDALKPCPFCGGAPDTYYDEPRWPEDGEREGFNITCKPCSFYDSVHFFGIYKNEAIEKWNTRHGDE